MTKPTLRVGATEIVLIATAVVFLAFQEIPSARGCAWMTSSWWLSNPLRANNFRYLTTSWRRHPCRCGWGCQ
jgi:hypothetical protein